MQGRSLQLVLGLLLAIVGCSGEEAREVASQDSGPIGTLVLGVQTDSPSEVDQSIEPFADLLAKRLRSAGIGRVEVRYLDTVTAVSEAMKAGEIDLYSDSPFPAAMVIRNSGAIPLVRRWRHGVTEYSSVIFARKDYGMESLSDLGGRTIAFQQPSSTSGYLLPLAILKGADFEVKAAGPAAPEPSAVGFTFSNDAETTVMWVLSGHRVDAGAINGSYLPTLAGPRLDELEIIHESHFVPRSLMVARARLDETLRNQIHDVLIAMADDPEGLKVLATYEQTDRFDDFPDGAVAALEPVFELIDFIGIEELS